MGCGGSKASEHSGGSATVTKYAVETIEASSAAPAADHQTLTTPQKSVKSKYTDIGEAVNNANDGDAGESEGIDNQATADTADVMSSKLKEYMQSPAKHGSSLSRSTIVSPNMRKQADESIASANAHDDGLAALPASAVQSSHHSSTPAIDVSASLANGPNSRSAGLGSSSTQKGLSFRGITTQPHDEFEFT